MAVTRGGGACFLSVSYASSLRQKLVVVKCVPGERIRRETKTISVGTYQTTKVGNEMASEREAGRKLLGGGGGQGPNDEVAQRTGFGDVRNVERKERFGGGLGRSSACWCLLFLVGRKGEG